MIVAGEAAGLPTLRALPTSPLAAMLFIHGLAEHARRHEPTLLALANRGIAAFAFDLHGHGNAAGTRDYVGDFPRLVTDTATMRREVARAVPGVPFFLAGFSMGGLVALRSAADDPGGLAGTILIAPGLDPAGAAPRLLKQLGCFVGRFVPFFPVARVDFRPYDAQPGETRLRRRIIAARTASELIRASSEAFRNAHDTRIPTLIFHGDRDRLVSARASRRYVERYGGDDVTLRIVAGGEHELLREPTGDAVRAEMIAWILARASTASERTRSTA